MAVIINRLTGLYDLLEHFWASKHTEHKVANLLIIIFMGSIALIELARQNLLPDELLTFLPKSHYYAIHVAFSLLLFFEVFGLVFSLAGSVSMSVGKQFQILSLILLRQSFEGMVHFSEPLAWESVMHPALNMIANAVGSLVIFLLLGIYYKLQRHRPITSNPETGKHFIASKKIVSLLLLSIFILIIITTRPNLFTEEAVKDFFSLFYTILVFSDVLLVLISLRYSSSYPVVFRNSGFAIATILIRLTLTAPPFFNVLLGIGATAFAIGITIAYNSFKDPVPDAIFPDRN
jgi:hypothetical protein